MGTAPRPVDPIARLAAEIRDGLASSRSRPSRRACATTPCRRSTASAGSASSGTSRSSSGSSRCSSRIPSPGGCGRAPRSPRSPATTPANREALGLRAARDRHRVPPAAARALAVRRAPGSRARRGRRARASSAASTTRSTGSSSSASSRTSTGRRRSSSLQARQDPLTGLLNHQAFTHALEAEVDRAARYGHGLALVFFDIDHFKEVNDTLGHPEGDRVLRCVAAMIDGTLRRNDVAGRMGGDEFAVALVESEADAGGVYLARLARRDRRADRRAASCRRGSRSARAWRTSRRTARPPTRCSAPPTGASTRSSGPVPSQRERRRPDPPAAATRPPPRSAVSGCSNASRAAWRNWRSSPRSPATP